MDERRKFKDLRGQSKAGENHLLLMGFWGDQWDQ